MKKIITGLAALAVTAALAPASAHGHVLSSGTASSTAATAAAKVKRGTGASSATVRSCKRQGDHRANCLIVARYRTGARSCTINVQISIPAGSRRASTRFGATVCS